MSESTTLHLNADPRELGIPGVEQYTGVWAVEEKHFQAQLTVIERQNFRLHAEQQIEVEQASEEFSAQVTRAGNIAMFRLQGTMTKRGSSWSTGGSTVRLRREIRAAARDPDIVGGFLVMETPGGTSAGTQELADDVAAFASEKPLFGFCEDICASAGYDVVSQATRVYANEPAVIGSIGTFLVVYDLSKAAADQGVKVHVVKAGDFKGSAIPGTEITPEQIAEYQSLVNSVNSLFKQTVMRGRGFTAAQIDQLADGRIHMAAAAVGLNLIDGVATLDEAFETLTQHIESDSKQRRKGTMSTDNQPATQLQAATAELLPKAATAAELQAALPNADQAFLFKQLTTNATVGAAQTAWIQKLESDATAAKEKSQADLAPKPHQHTGCDAIGGGGDSSAPTYENPSQQWNQALRAELEFNGGPNASAAQRAAAVRNVDQSNPGLRDAMLVDTNRKAGRHAALAIA